MSEFLLRETLRLALPLWLAQMRQEPLTEDDWQWARSWAPVLGSKGDMILYRSGKKGGTAALFNDLARAIAIMAHAPGGITFLGDHWEQQE